MPKRTPLTIALLNPVNLAMLVLSIAAGLGAAWWLAPVGLILWVVMVVVIAREPSLQFSYVLENRAGLATRFQKKFDQINRTHTRIFNTIISSKPRVRKELQSVLKTSATLIDSVYALCSRLTPVENNRLVTQSTGGMTLEMENLQTKINNASDPIIKQEYEQARQSIAHRITQFQHHTTQLDRVDAQLVSLKNELDNLHAAIVGLQSKSVEEIRKAVPEILETLNTEIAAFQAFEREIDI